jgi:hypothetical protein
VNVLKPHLQTTIWTLLAAGASQREIERATGIDRQSIRGTRSVSLLPQQIPPGCRPAREGKFLHPVYRLRCRRARPRRFRRASRTAGSLRLRRNAMAIYQDLVDQQGFTARYESVMRFARKLR